MQPLRNNTKCLKLVHKMGIKIFTTTVLSWKKKKDNTKKRSENWNRISQCCLRNRLSYWTLTRVSVNKWKDGVKGFNFSEKEKVCRNKAWSGKNREGVNMHLSPRGERIYSVDKRTKQQEATMYSKRINC